MSKILIIIFCELLDSLFFKSQVNLVSNYSFEFHTSCPDNEDQIYLSDGWIKFNGTPDYFHECAASINVSVPNNLYGSFQYPYEGKAYAGLYTYFSWWPWGYNLREYIASKLIQPLITGHKYKVSFKTSLAYNKWSIYSATNKLGVKFTSTSYLNYALSNPNASSPLTNNFAHIYTNEIITDTVNWKEISGYFVADSNYTYIVIGNFFDDNHTDSINFIYSTASYAYYYIDNVEVVEVEEENYTNTFNIPNIFTPNNDNVNDYFSVQLSGYKHIEYYIYNRWGELVHSDKRNITSNGQKEEPLWDGKINREYANTGVYYYVIKLITAKDEEEIKRGYITLLK